MLVLIVTHLSQRKMREATIVIYHPKKKHNLPLISYFFDYVSSNLLTSDEVVSFSPEHDVERPLYANIRATRGEHGLYNQQTIVSYSSSMPWRNAFTP
jgi:hypothetical protein